MASGYARCSDWYFPRYRLNVAHIRFFLLTVVLGVPSAKLLYRFGYP